MNTLINQQLITATASIHSNSKFIRLAMLRFFEHSYRITLLYGEGDDSRPRPAETALPTHFKNEIIAFVEESSKESWLVELVCIGKERLALVKKLHVAITFIAVRIKR
jgi:hypothetical protein